MAPDSLGGLAQNRGSVRAALFRRLMPMGWDSIARDGAPHSFSSYATLEM